MTNAGQLDFIDVLSILSFLVALMNLDENMTQGDKQELQEDLANKADILLSEIHSHLEMQDIKLEGIIKRLEDIEHGIEGNICQIIPAYDSGDDGS